MVFPVVGGDGKPTGYEIDNSLRFNEGDSPTLNITFGSEGSKRTMTFSFWLKRSNFGDEVYSLYSAGADANNRDQIRFLDESLDIIFQRNDTTYYRLRTNRLFRDPSAWYHIVIGIDTTDGTSSNRIKLYVNGVQESSFATSDYPTQNLDLYFNDDIVQYIGRQFSSDANHYGGYIAEWHFIDGTQYASSNFGETNDNGVWIPKKFADSFGSNGFKLEFQQTGTSQNSSGIGADTSGNDNHFAVSNLAATDVTTDTPTNNFATWNPLAERPGDGFITASEGNVKATGSSKHAFPTIAFPTSGKWYVEVKFTAGSSTAHLGLRDADDYSADGNSNRLYYRNDGDKDDGGTTSSYGASWTNSIISIAVNLDDNEVTFYKDGTAQNSGTALSHDASNQYLSAGTAGSYTVEGNFGNPSFAISSGNADANGHGNFEYAVPSGYFALCTKNLAEYG